MASATLFLAEARILWKVGREMVHFLRTLFLFHPLQFLSRSAFRFFQR
jgi:hypothetical protein